MITYEEIIQRMLARVPDTVDKREGSMIFDALAPAAIELVQMYVELQGYLDLVFVDTSSEDYLTRLCSQFGVDRQAATYAIRKASFEGVTDIPIGGRFTIDDLVYSATEKIQDGIYKVKCETAGTIGNKSFGKMVPVSFIEGLKSITLEDVLVPGEETETDENLKSRYFDYVREPAFGGNIADYKRKVKALDGVGQVKVFPVWNGEGTVKLVILDSECNKPSESLIENVNNAVLGDVKGLGIAPIGHIVTINAVGETPINFTIKDLRLKDGYIQEVVEASIKTSLESYLLSLRKEWESQNTLLARVTYTEYKVLDVEGVLDLNEVQLNNSRANVEIVAESIPVLGEVVFEYAT